MSIKMEFFKFLVFPFLLIMATSSYGSNKKNFKFNSGKKWLQSEEWVEVNKLIKEEKFKAAKTIVDEKLKKFQETRDDYNWTLALILKQKLGQALHSVETAVKNFKNSPWPKNPSSQLLLSLYYAQAIDTYYNYYSYEIGRREKVKSSKKLDLKKWTKEDLFQEIQNTLFKVWEKRKELDSLKTEDYSDFIQEGSFPREVRGTMRDAFVYFYSSFLKNTRHWSAAHINEINLINLKKVLKENIGKVELLDSNIHPILKINYILNDHLKWNWNSDRVAGLLEAKYEKIRIFNNQFSKEDDKKILFNHLKSFLRDYKIDPWWSEGQYVLANIKMKMFHETRFVEARKIALSGKEEFPDSIGGKRCSVLVSTIERPSLSIESMKHDLKGKRSIKISSKNLENIYFRAFKFDPVKHFLGKTQSDILPYRHKILETLGDKKPDYSWESKLNLQKDFRNHITFVKPEIEKNGFYIVLASNDKGFKKDTGNQINSFFFNQTNIAVLSENNDKRQRLNILNANNSSPIKNATVSLYEMDWDKGHKHLKDFKVDKKGRFDHKKIKKHKNIIYAVRTKDDFYFSEYQIHSYHKAQNREVETGIIFTDRSVFRPGQKINFKVITFKNRSNGSSGKLPIPLPKKEFEIKLMDANGKIVETAKLKTDEYSTGAGSFTIPKGRALGNWSLRLGKISGNTYLKVEEYKRPTFITELNEAKSDLKLNHKAIFSGKANYYYGQPLKGAKVKYKITRQSYYPSWYSYYWPGRYNSRNQIIASGETKSNDKGEYDISFTPKGETGSNSKDITYRYEISVEVLDIGGETASASKSFLLGAVSVKASFSGSKTLFSKSKNLEFNINRSDLNNKPIKGEGEWTLYKTKGKLLAPSEWPKNVDLPFRVIKKKFMSKGDNQRSRWNGEYRTENILDFFKIGKSTDSGKVVHDKNGVARLKLSNVKPGSYRIVYTTKDKFKNLIKVNKNFVVLNGKSAPSIPLYGLVNKTSVKVKDRLKFQIGSGYKGQNLYFNLYHFDKLILSKKFKGGSKEHTVTLKVKKEHLGGLNANLYSVKDNTYMVKNFYVSVPYNDQELDISFSKIRDKVYPGVKETWKVKVLGKKLDGKTTKLKNKAQVLSYMYDKSLDVFGPHYHPGLFGYFPNTASQIYMSFPHNLNYSSAIYSGFKNYSTKQLYEDRIKVFESYGVGGLGRRGFRKRGRHAPMMFKSSRIGQAKRMSKKTAKSEMDLEENAIELNGAMADSMEAGTVPTASDTPKKQIRSNFAETGYWMPSLLTNKKGEVEFSFTVPDSLTSWNVWASAITKDLKVGSIQKNIKSAKDLMVKTYFPRFFRQGDTVKLKVVVENTGDTAHKGKFSLSLSNAVTKANMNDGFKLEAKFKEGEQFEIGPGETKSFSIKVVVPNVFNTVNILAKADMGKISDGELKKLNILPSRIHLAQSKFITLNDISEKKLEFKDMLTKHTSLKHDSMVVKVDGQLFYSLLSAVPYLVNFPYDCTEQTMNRFLSTSILSSTFKEFPSVEKMAKKLSKRKTKVESFNQDNPNRKMALIETPWVAASEGGGKEDFGISNILNPTITSSVRSESLSKLIKAQTASGGFPWFDGGRPSWYITNYILYSFGKALEFGGEVPLETVKKAWTFMAEKYRRTVKSCMAKNHCFESVTYINYVASMYKDSKYLAGSFTADERKEMLEYSLERWKKHSPQLRAMLAMTSKRMGDVDSAKTIFESIMDSAKTEENLGTFWAPENRSWLWYNDTIESHAMALRAMMEIQPENKLRHGLVQWLFLNKKLNHWKSTKVTAEVIYSVLHYLRKEKKLNNQEKIQIKIGKIEKEFVFSPDEYTGRDNYITVSGTEIDPKTMNKVVAKQKTKGMSFISATWHYSTEKLPTTNKGDLFSINRTYFKRGIQNNKIVLLPLKEGTKIAVGDEVEVHISIKAKHEAEYIHLRDPRPAGFEPERKFSGYKWDLGLIRYEEVRDSGMNFFFENIPVGEYTLKHRVRANLSGEFRSNPATLQSVYAPEFRAFSSGVKIKVE